MPRRFAQEKFDVLSANFNFPLKDENKVPTGDYCLDEVNVGEVSRVNVGNIARPVKKYVLVLGISHRIDRFGPPDERNSRVKFQVFEAHAKDIIFVMRRGTKRGNNSKELEGINGLFEKYRDKTSSESTIGPDGVEQLCEDLGVPASDVRILMLAWKLRASRMGYFTEEEWRSGLLSMHADSLEKLQQALPMLEKETSQPMVFREFFRYSFEFCCTEPRQKTLDLDTASQMLGLVMPNSPHTEPFLKFLQEQNGYKALTMDQWQGFLRFCEETLPDASNYDESQAWPLLIDSFVEWLKFGTV
ncbi:hypothetical protein CYMTET_30931 [Cymbomonas tetramitiformis]|uniref:Defective in cullin neddylation protein n=1 Tax=Cymbomonas tetramitiformis TaxID=36881 RepID=A0AAE0FI53_9CHLO|nr:hypothetical protein CYMTET_30931 [Cymbomonas tetramitiformis]